MNVTKDKIRRMCISCKKEQKLGELNRINLNDSMSVSVCNTCAKKLISDLQVQVGK